MNPIYTVVILGILHRIKVVRRTSDVIFLIVDSLLSQKL